MSDTKKTIVIDSIKAGMGRLETRNALISQGESSSGFDELYTACLTELGVAEPKQVMPTHVQVTGEMPLGTASRREKVRTNAKRKSIFVLLLIIIASIGFMGMGVVAAWPIIQKDFFPGTIDRSLETTSGSVETYSDDVLKTKVEATEASVGVYKGRMGSVDGVCRDISVVPPVMCIQSGDNYAIFAPLSNRTYFCKDKTGFVGSVQKKPENNALCQ